MYTIPGAVNIAARNTFVALDNIKLLLLPQRACGVCKAALTADAAPLSWIANMNMPVVLLFALPLAGDDVELKILIAQRGKRPRDKRSAPPSDDIFGAQWPDDEASLQVSPCGGDDSINGDGVEITFCRFCINGVRVGKRAVVTCPDDLAVNLPWRPERQF